MNKTFIDIIGKNEWDEMSDYYKNRLCSALKLAKIAINSKSDNLVIRYGTYHCMTDNEWFKVKKVNFKKEEYEKFVKMIVEDIKYGYKVDEFAPKHGKNCVCLSYGKPNEYLMDDIEKFVRNEIVK